MSKNWLRAINAVVVVSAALMMSHTAFAHPGPVAVAAPEIDPRLTIEGLALAGGAAALLWEGIRRRRR
jgi:hypothetical protein